MSSKPNKSALRAKKRKNNSNSGRASGSSSSRMRTFVPYIAPSAQAAMDEHIREMAQRGLTVDVDQILQHLALEAFAVPDFLDGGTPLVIRNIVDPSDNTRALALQLVSKPSRDSKGLIVFTTERLDMFETDCLCARCEAKRAAEHAKVAA